MSGIRDAPCVAFSLEAETLETALQPNTQATNSFSPVTS